jgi:predicted thioesterase
MMARTRAEDGMKASLRPGVEMTRRLTIDRDRTIGFMGEAARVYATPSMVSDVEYACRELLLAHLEGGEDSVGARVEIDHLAPALLGAAVEIAVQVAELNGRRVTFAFSVKDAIEELGRGRHTRFVVDTAKVEERLLAKAARMKTAG